MTRVFEKQELEAVAAKATEASPQDVLKRFYVPIVGTLRCKYIGPQNSEDIIVFNTNVAFKWEFSSPHVKGSIEQALSNDLMAGVTRGSQNPYTLRFILRLSSVARAWC